MNTCTFFSISLFHVAAVVSLDACSRSSADSDEQVFLQVDVRAVPSRIALPTQSRAPSHASTNASILISTDRNVTGKKKKKSFGQVLKGVGSAISGIADGIHVDNGNKSEHPIEDIIDSVGSAVSGVAGIIDSVENPNNASLKDRLTNGLGAIGQIAGGVAEGVTAGETIADGVKEARSSDQLALDGHSNAFINLTILCIVLVVGSITSCAYAVDVWLPEYSTPKDRPKLWVLTMLAASYALLIPSLGQILFSFKLVGEFMGFHIVLTSGDGFTPNNCITESALSVIGLLFSTGGYVGALFLILYAMIVPAVKLMCLCVSEFYRNSPDPGAVRLSRGGILFVQAISKWACPDMFAYILLLYLLRKVGENNLISTPAQLDVGFSCFSAFCVLSTFACMGIKPPDPPEDLEELDDDAPPPAPPTLFRIFGEKGIFHIATFLTTAFMVLLGFGIVIPCMGLRIDSKAFIEPNGPAPKSLEPIIDGLHLDENLSAKVNVYHCLYTLVEFIFKNGEGNCIFALIMLGGFAIAFPICEMFLLAFASSQLKGFEKQGVNDLVCCRTTMKIIKFLGHIGMLDVFVMGVVVITLAASMYRKMGTIFTLESGVILLFMAEVVHYALYRLMTDVVDYLERLLEYEYRLQ